jgi:hypothetical protein
MNYTAGFGINLKWIAFSVMFGLDFTHAGIGGDVMIESVGEHPGLYFRVILVFLWLKVTIYRCEHGIHP